MGVKAASEQTQGQTQGQEVGQDHKESELADGVRIGIGKEEKIQDVLVPWVLKNKPKPKPKSKPTQSKSKQNSQSQSQLPIDPQDEAATNTTKINDKKDVRRVGNDNGPVSEDKKEEGEEKEEEEKEETQEEEKVFNRYYHLFIEGELRDLIFEAGIAEGYRILPSAESSSSSIPSTTTTSSTSTKQTTTNPGNQIPDHRENEDENENGKWLRIRGEGWEADNWWVEAEVGVGAGQ